MPAAQCYFCDWKQERFGNRVLDDSCPGDCVVRQIKTQATRLNQMTLVQGRKFKKLVEVLDLPPERFDAEPG